MKTRLKRIQVRSIVKIKPEYFEQSQHLHKEEDHICYTFNPKTGEQKMWLKSELHAYYVKARVEATWIVTKIFPKSNNCHIRCVTDTQLHFKGTIDPKNLICVISCL